MQQHLEKRVNWNLTSQTFNCFIEPCSDIKGVLGLNAITHFSQYNYQVKPDEKFKNPLTNLFLSLKEYCNIVHW